MTNSEVGHPLVGVGEGVVAGEADAAHVGVVDGVGVELDASKARPGRVKR